MNELIHLPQPEERPSGESIRAKSAFLDYCAMGSSRSLNGLLEQMQADGVDISINTLRRWGQNHNWLERAEQYDAEIAAEKRRQRVLKIEQMRQEHAEIGHRTLLLAAERIQALIERNEFNATAAVNLFRIAAYLERDALIEGIPIGLQVETHEDERELTIKTQWGTKRYTGAGGEGA